MNAFAKAIQAELHRLADLNSDGKVDKADVELAVRTIASQTEHHPFAAVIIASAIAVIFTWALMRITGC